MARNALASEGVGQRFLVLTMPGNPLLIALPLRADCMHFYSLRLRYPVAQRIEMKRLRATHFAKSFHRFD